MLIKEEQDRVSALPYSLPKKLRDILDGFKWAVREKKTSAVLILDGKSGMGKSTLASQIGLYCDPNFGLENIYYEPKAFMEGLANAKPQSYHMFDEALLISSRNALSDINKMIVGAMSMIRSKRLIVTFCCNSIFDLDRNLGLFRANLLLHLYGDSLSDRGKFLAFFQGKGGADNIKELFLRGKKYYSYSQPRANFFARFGSYFTVDEKEYEKRKQVGVNNYLLGKSNKKVHHDTIRLQKLVYTLKEVHKWTIEEISEASGTPERTLYKQIVRHKESIE